MSSWFKSELLAAAIVLLAWTASSYAAGPSMIMVYGGSLPGPIIIVKKDPGDHSYLSCMGSMSIDPRQLGDRPYFNLAIFWQQPDPAATRESLKSLKPEQASQHGRLYLPKGNTSASVVATPYSSMPGVRMPGQDTEQFTPIPRLLPADDKAFTRGCWLSSEDVTAARAVGIPGL